MNPPPKRALTGFISLFIFACIVCLALWSEHGRAEAGGAQPPSAAVVAGESLIGGDLTDPENNGDPENDVNYNATFNASEEPNFGGSEGAFNVFDNLLGTGNNKWCCGDQNNFPTNPITVDATFAAPIVLRRFTVSSAKGPTSARSTKPRTRPSPPTLALATPARSPSPTLPPRTTTAPTPSSSKWATARLILRK